MTVTVRFAPSPTGYIHIGNARTALFNWLFAMQKGGQFILRFDDTDTERSRQEYADATQYDLHWLGIFPDKQKYQSRRFDIYADAVDTLKAKGLLYPCYETEEELELRRKIRRSRKMPPVYGREALVLSDKEKAEYAAEGRRPHWRFLLPNYASDPLEPRHTKISWEDIIKGKQTVDLASLSDPVLVREDGTYLYTLPSVADDVDLGISHVIRGDDHVTNTGVQIEIFKALGAEPPVFGHHNLLTTASGEGLSKRSGALSIGGLREDGVEPMSIASLAVLHGTSENVVPCGTMAELAQHFDLATVSKSSAKFDPDELVTLNRAILHHMDFSDAQDRLGAHGVSGERAEEFWNVVRGNLDRLQDAAGWWRIVRDGPHEKPELSDADAEFVRAAFDLLPPEPWDQTTWKTWIAAVREGTGRKGKQLFTPLRVAITGRESGPELADLLPLIGYDGMMARRP
ncbi:MAG: glutamate--tRNA ligase [Rhizobiaceae bacterium]|nr:glutamate--tRNA ligase [Rhizobiaceae bacterium]